MAEPTLNLSFQDLLVRVVKEAGVAYHGSDGSARAMVPIDESDFVRCKDVVNDGIRMFISMAPINGWRWMNRMMEVTLAPEYTGTAESGTSTSLTDSTIAGTYANDYFNDYTLKITDGTGEDETATITDYIGATGVFEFSAGLSGGSTPDSTSQYRICRSTSVIDADPARYQLSEDFCGEVSTKPTYKAGTNWGHLLDWVSEATIRSIREVSVREGYPTRAAIRPYTNRRWELIVDPQPSSAGTIIFPYRVGFNRIDAVSGTATDGSDTTVVNSSLANLYPDDYFVDWVVYVIDGTGKNSYATVTAYTGSSGTFTVAKWLAIDGAATGTSPAANSIYYVSDGNTHPAGMQFDEAVLSACLAKAQEEFNDVITKDYISKFLNIDLPSAHRIDARSAPLKLGPMLPGTRSAHYKRVWKDVEYS